MIKKNLSIEISQYSANEFARCNRYCTAFMTVCIPVWPQSNYYSLYLCPLRHQDRKTCVLFPKKLFFQTSVGYVHLFVFTPTAKSFHDRSVISRIQSEVLENGIKRILPLLEWLDMKPWSAIPKTTLSLGYVLLLTTWTLAVFC